MHGFGGEAQTRFLAEQMVEIFRRQRMVSSSRERQRDGDTLRGGNATCHSYQDQPPVAEATA